MRQYQALPAGRPRSQYNMVEGRGVEQEVGALLYGLVRMVKPIVCIETGTFVGDSAEWIGRALRDNGTGRLITCDIDPERIGPARQRFLDLPMVDVVQMSGQDLLASRTSPMHFVHIDSGDPNVREKELMSLGDHNIAPGGIVCWHDACVAYQNMYGSFAAARDWPHLVLPSVVGFAIFQRPE